MTDGVTVVDYGIGNLFSVRRAFENCGAVVHVTDSPRDIESARRLVLPGVGAFADGMQGLRDRNLVEAIRRYGSSGRPMLGICLGMQLLATRSEEFGDHEGLGLFPGRVVAVPKVGLDGRPHKIPHIGWSGLVRPAGRLEWKGTILEPVPEGAAVYLVHSYTLVPDSPDLRLADCYYDGQLISAALRRGTVFGCQFHPEKSGPIGLAIIRQFAEL